MITLEEAKVGMADKVDQKVVDEFRRSNLLLDMLVFDNAISPGTGGSTLTYGYIQLLTPSTANVRTINSEYTAGEAKRTEKTAKAVIMGGKFQLDRVIIGTDGAVDELAFQMNEKIKATSNYFNNLTINGNGSDEGTGVLNTFDGLSKILTGSQNEFTSTIDISDSSKLDANYQAFLDEVDTFLTALDGKPSILLMNDKMLGRMRSTARRAGYYERNKDDFGRYVETYNGIPMYDMGKYYNGSATVDIIPIDAQGKSDIYAISIGIDAFHGISPTGSKVISTYMPDLNEPGAVKDGEVELIAGVVLKNANKAGVLRGIKIATEGEASK